MTGILEFSIRLYQRLLFLYPEELRRDFGDEMVLAFADDLRQAWGDARLAGVAQMWWYALRELVTVALPAQQSNPYVAVPALSFLATLSTQGTLVWLGMHQQPQIDLATAWRLVWGAVLLTSLMNALVALIVTRFYAQCSIQVLWLE